MKRVFVLLCILILIFISGCKKKVSTEELFKVCSTKSNSKESSYKIQSEYKIYGKDNLVTKIEKEETVISDDEEMLKYFEEYLSVSYSNLNEKYGGYRNTILKENNRVVSNTTILLSGFDLKEYANDNEVMKNYVEKDYSITLESAALFYEEKLSAQCK